MDVVREYLWTFVTLKRVVEGKGLGRWQRGTKLFMRGLESLDGVVFENGGFYFREGESIDFGDVPQELLKAKLEELGYFIDAW